MLPIRVVFTKKGRARFISHLDINRTFMRALRRAGIPVVYSQGFNPIPRINFALPLPVGVESVCEIFNFKVEADAVNLTQLGKILSSVLPEGIDVIEAYIPPEGKRLLKYSEYDIRISMPQKDDFSAASLEEFLGHSEINVMKRTKRGESMTNISTYIKSYSVTSGTNSITAKCVLTAADPEYLNPEYVVKAICDVFGIDPDDCSVTRTRVFNEDMQIYR